MRVVLDSLVLIAAAISRAGTSSAVLEDVIAHHELVLSEYILEEVERKLRGKLGFSARDVRRLLALLRHASELVKPAELPRTACRDVKDIPALGTAVAGKALALITGDKDLLTISAYGMTQIIGPSRFWALHSTAPSP